MAFVVVSGEPGCRHENLAGMAAERLQCELVTESNLEQKIAAQYGESSRIIPDKAWRPLAASILATLGLEHSGLVVCCAGAELLWGDLPAVFRFHVVAPERIRLDNLMSDCRLSRAQAKDRLRTLAAAQGLIRKRRFGQRSTAATSFDMVVNAQAMGAAEMVDLLVSALKSQGLLEAGPMSAQAAAKV